MLTWKYPKNIFQVVAWGGRYLISVNKAGSLPRYVDCIFIWGTLLSLWDSYLFPVIKVSASLDASESARGDGLIQSLMSLFRPMTDKPTYTFTHAHWDLLPDSIKLLDKGVMQERKHRAL